jgi:hypothetical protein
MFILYENDAVHGTFASFNLVIFGWSLMRSPQGVHDDMGFPLKGHESGWHGQPFNCCHFRGFFISQLPTNKEWNGCDATKSDHRFIQTDLKKWYEIIKVPHWHLVKFILFGEEFKGYVHFSNGNEFGNIAH